MERSPSALRNTLASIWSWSVIAFSITLSFPFVLIWRIVGWPFDRVNYFGGRLFRFAGRAMVRSTPRWEFTTRGVYPDNPRLPFVVVVNHESFADILLLCCFPWEMKWLSKVEIMRIPVLGWTMWAANDVPVRRGLAASARAAMAACRRRLELRCSVVIFPEGTRSPTHEMLPFRDGAFRLAIDAGVPILPIVIAGTRDAIARHDWRINPARAIAEVLTPEPVTPGMKTAELRERVRVRIAEARERLHKELGQE